jgi:predicted permease
MNRHDLWLRLRALFFRRRVEEELDEELAFHIELETRKNVTPGMSEADARRRARIEFGGEAIVREACRDARRVNLIETLWQDVRYALRGFRRAPAFALTVIATIALGLGLNTTVFTIFNAYVLRPIAVRDPYSLYGIYWIDRAGRGHRFNWQEYVDFREHNPAFPEAIAVRNLQVRLNGRMAFGQIVSGEYFRTLGVAPARGRMLTPADSSAPGREPVAVLSYVAWQNLFGADPEIVGKKILIRGYPFEVVGVARDGFTGLEEQPRDFWAPVSMATQLMDGPSPFGPEHPESFDILGRLRPGWSEEQARAALTPWVGRLTAGRTGGERATGAVLRSRATVVHLDPQGLLILLPILSAFALVLLIACANVANMMLARGMARQREIGIRLSLGAARARVVRQLLTESVLLALPAGAAAFAVSEATIELGVRAMFATLPSEFAEFIRVVPLQPDARVFFFMLGAAIASALLFGLVPALQATRSGIVQAARGDFSSDFRPARLRNALVVTQITVCALLLICSAVLLRGANCIRRLDSGLRTRDVVEIEIQEKLLARVLARLTAEPLVDILAATANPPLDGMFPMLAGGPAGASLSIRAAYNDVSPEYFTVFDLPILRGRNFSAGEAAAAAPVAILSETAARRLWPHEEALGQSLRLGNTRTTRHRQALVIGIARDAVMGVVGDEADRTCIYFPTSARAPGNALLVRVKGDAEAARRTLDAALTAVDPGAVQQIHKMQEFVAGRVYPYRVAYWVSAAVGGLALLLTVSGIYGVLSYLVTQRTKEIGIRMALGATAGAVSGMVLKQLLCLASLGIALGVLLALGASRMFAWRLVMMNTYDGVAYAGAVLLVTAASVAAAYFPSRRAARIDPTTTLRYD